MPGSAKCTVHSNPTLQLQSPIAMYIAMPIIYLNSVVPFSDKSEEEPLTEKVTTLTCCEFQVVQVVQVFCILQQHWIEQLYHVGFLLWIPAIIIGSERADAEAYGLSLR